LIDAYPATPRRGAVFVRVEAAPWEMRAFSCGFRRFLPAKRAYRAENPSKTAGKEGPAAAFSFRETSDFKAL
jgi:hypothetical protein